MRLIPVEGVPTQKIDYGGQTYDAAAVILIRNREEVMAAMSKGQTARPEVQFITFQSPIGRDRLFLANEVRADMLAIVMADGTAKYLAEESHMRFAEQIVHQLEAKLILRLHRPDGVN
jgi:hypothetical protein